MEKAHLRFLSRHNLLSKSSPSQTQFGQAPLKVIITGLSKKLSAIYLSGGSCGGFKLVMNAHLTINWQGTKFLNATIILLAALLQLLLLLLQ